MTSRRHFLSRATAGAAAASLTSVGRLAAEPAPGSLPHQTTERQRLIAEANFGRKQKATGKKGMAITSHPLATRAAVDMLRAGGNACDAALCASMVQTVIEPHMVGITGILSTMNYQAATGTTGYVNGGANVPLGVRTGDGGRAPWGPGVPGFWAGFEETLARFGTKSKRELVAPAILLARDGFETHPFLWGEIFMTAELIGKDAAGRAIYFPDKHIPRPGELLYQKEAADTLERLVAEGNEYYYRGEFAEEFCRVSQSAGRNITMKDMERYQARFQTPAWGTYRGFKIAG
jgi:gamma-glutamyltranspeptidase/glutathione hydrolase